VDVQEVDFARFELVGFAVVDCCERSSQIRWDLVCWREPGACFRSFAWRGPLPQLPVLLVSASGSWEELVIWEFGVVSAIGSWFVQVVVLVAEVLRCGAVFLSAMGSFGL
jgi:hypothetical protein